jgi:putative ATP-dependent endonuclease of OLD family
MHVSSIEISNFRGVKTAHVRFSGHSVLIGPNNSGKTTIIEALALVLGRNGLVRGLTEHDFFGSSPAAADRITITAAVTGFAPDDFTQHPEWFGNRRGVPCWLEEKTGRILAEPAAGTVLACQITFAARFDAETLEVETRRVFTDADGVDVFDDDSLVGVPPRLIRDVGFFLVPASRT